MWLSSYVLLCKWITAHWFVGLCNFTVVLKLDQEIEKKKENPPIMTVGGHCNVHRDPPVDFIFNYPSPTLAVSVVAHAEN